MERGEILFPPLLSIFTAWIRLIGGYHSTGAGSHLFLLSLVLYIRSPAIRGGPPCARFWLRFVRILRWEEGVSVSGSSRLEGDAGLDLFVVTRVLGLSILLLVSNSGFALIAVSGFGLVFILVLFLGFG
ncbi:unnamed protein product [Arabis nemorensis]|uniref:Uncharacterized protein n=1 Tax=Arabis nemorensis TaxID=586526 RepID=A0A565B3Q1_9BRAS|nr:unnamed protein product [Arabis nemorensis]